MNDTALIEALREKFAISEVEREYLDGYYNGECDPDMDDNADDNWYNGIELGTIETKAELLEFLNSFKSDTFE